MDPHTASRSHPGARGGAAVAYALLALTLTACASSRSGPPPLAVPAIDARAAHFAGSPILGVEPGGAARLERDPARALLVRGELLYLERLPRDGLTPLEHQVELVVRPSGRQPLETISSLTADAWIAHDGAALRGAVERGEHGRFVASEPLDTALPPGATIAWTIAPRDGAGPTLSIALARGTGDDLRWTFSHENARAAAQDALVVASETVVIEARPEIDGAAAALIVRSPFAGGDGEGFAAFLSVARPTSDASGVAERLARTLDECARAEQELDRRGSRFVAAEQRERELASALGSLQVASDRRFALLFLANATGAELALDVALTAVDATIDAFVDRATSGADVAVLAANGATLGWVLERAAFEFLAREIDEGRLAPELSSLLVRRAGEVGRSAGAIDDVIAGASTLDALRARLVDENLISLEDASPAVRVRAFDWLAARELAPPGYDPLSPIAERRDALNAYQTVLDARQPEGSGR